MEINAESFLKAFLTALESKEFVTKLQSVHKDYTKELQSIQDQLNQKNELIRKFSEQINKDREEIKRLNYRVDSLENELDSMEQYTRRNSVRIFGIPENENEQIYDIVLKTLNQHMEVDVGLRDIDRAHRVGRVTSNGKRGIIVKFNRYQTKEASLKARRKLREKGLSIYVNEDLTKHRADLLYAARCKKRQGLLEDCWSYDGKILVKTKSRRIKPVNNRAELEDICSEIQPPKPFSMSRTSQGSQQTQHGRNSHYQSKSRQMDLCVSSLKHHHSPDVMNNSSLHPKQRKLGPTHHSHDRIMATNDPGEPVRKENSIQKSGVK